LIQKETKRYHPNSVYINDRFRGAGAPRRFNQELGKLDWRLAPEIKGGKDPFFFIMHGYFESYKYFCHIQDEVKRDMRTFLQPYARTAKNDVVVAEESVVAVHLRVGDKTRESDECSYTAKYVKDAFDWFLAQHSGEKQLIFKIFCGASPGAPTGLADCGKLVPSDALYAPSIRWHKATTAVADLALMAQCDHAIITLGTFGWWAGFLVEGNVVAMRRQWLKAKRRDESDGNQDLYPPEWVVLENECEGVEDETTTAAAKEGAAVVAGPGVSQKQLCCAKKARCCTQPAKGLRGGKLRLSMLYDKSFVKHEQYNPAPTVGAGTGTSTGTGAATMAVDCARSDLPGCPFAKDHALSYLCSTNPLPMVPSTAHQEADARVLRIVNRDKGEI
jgi:hypothetical protein